VPAKLRCDTGAAAVPLEVPAVAWRTAANRLVRASTLWSAIAQFVQRLVVAEGSKAPGAVEYGGD
jgi:hypothetical protein